MKINIHAGHTSALGAAPGADGFINESTEARNLVGKLIELFRSHGHVVYDCTAEGSSEGDNLYKIVEKCNSNDVDIDLSVHFNAFNGDAHGSEVWTYSDSANSYANALASNVCEALESIGFTNRGVKHNSSLYVLRNTKAPAMLIEVCFVDNYDDCNLYGSNKDEIARAIAKAVTGEDYEKISNDKLYRVQVGAFKDYKNAVNYCEQIKAAGFDCFVTSD